MDKIKKEVNDCNKEVVKELSNLYNKLSDSLDKSYYYGQKSGYEEINTMSTTSLVTTGENLNNIEKYKKKIILKDKVQHILLKEIQPIIKTIIKPIIEKEIQPIIQREIQPIIQKEIHPVYEKENIDKIKKLKVQKPNILKTWLANIDKIAG